MNIQIALDYVGYHDKYDSEYLYDCLYMEIFGIILKKFLYSGISLYEGYLISKDNKFYILAGLEGPMDCYFMSLAEHKYKELDNRLKKYFKLDSNDYVYYEYVNEKIKGFRQEPYIKIELTGIDNKKDMVYLDTIKKLVEDKNE